MSYYEFASLFWFSTALAGLWMSLGAVLFTSSVGHQPSRRLRTVARSVRTSLDSVGTKLFPGEPSSPNTPLPSSPSHPSWPGAR
jgi:hypothetical protein